MLDPGGGAKRGPSEQFVAEREEDAVHGQLPFDLSAVRESVPQRGAYEEHTGRRSESEGMKGKSYEQEIKEGGRNEGTKERWRRWRC